MIFSGFYIYVLRRKKDTETKKKSEKDEESNKKGTGKKFIKGGKGMVKRGGVGHGGDVNCNGEGWAGKHRTHIHAERQLVGGSVCGSAVVTELIN